MSHGRHRLFDAKRRNYVLARVMVGPSLRMLHEFDPWW